MPRSGQEEERPGEGLGPAFEARSRMLSGAAGGESLDGGPAGITYFDFSDPFGPTRGHPEALTEAFSASPFETHDTARQGVSRARRPAAPPPFHAASSPPRDVFEFALADLSMPDVRRRDPDPGPASKPSSAPRPEPSTAQPALEPEPPAPNPSEPDVAFASLASFVEPAAEPDPAAEERQRFVRDFEAARARGPFLALALRMTPGVPTAAWFPLVEEAFVTALPDGSSSLVDRTRMRVVALLPGHTEAAARPLFARLMDSLEDHIADADLVGHDIAVFPAPDGRPFASAESLLATTFDGP